MITINDTPFYDKPGSCGTCPWFSNGSTHLQPNMGKGYCRMFDEMHHSYINPPPEDAKSYLIRLFVCQMEVD